MTRLVCLLFLALGGCGYVNYDDAPAGSFKGSLFVMWLEEGGPLGDGAFLYVPNPRDPLTFTRTGAQGSVRTIRPAMMYTDGGSIPRQAQLFRGFSPWGYAPAYMVHDYLFVVRHCLTDNASLPGEAKYHGITFQESAQIIAEAIKGVIASGKARPNQVAPQVISGVVAGPFSYRRWTVSGACAGDRVSPEDEAAANSGIPGASGVGIRGLQRSLPDGRRVPVERGQVVATLTF